MGVLQRVPAGEVRGSGLEEGPVGMRGLLRACRECEIVIPKVFHQIWLGPKPMPEQHRVWSRTWLRLNPGWTLRLWTGPEELSLVNQREFDTARHAVEQSDILRYEIVYRLGGCYIDTDFECLRRFDWRLLTNEAFVGLETEERVNNALFAAERRHPWLEAVIHQLPLHRAARASKSVAERTGPDLLQAVTSGRRDVKVFPASYFYPMPIEQRKQHRQPLEAGRYPGDQHPGAYAVHHYELSWRDME